MFGFVVSVGRQRKDCRILNGRTVFGLVFLASWSSQGFVQAHSIRPSIKLLDL